ncbi:MAG: DUF3991 and TOPRIM domain-containing protein [Ruminiclostridium sp.]|nr:DUF3991 and TOPRIM domain-containing protein [Ruminiclostridium sp.]
MWVTEEQIRQAKEMDLLTYLKEYEPDNLIHISNGTYCTKEHDSLKISNGLWHWFSRNIGGKTALDYLIKVKGFSFTEAVLKLSATSAPVVQKLTVSEKKPVKSIEMPRVCADPLQAKQYLLRRGINESLIDFCVENGLLYEDEKYHSCLFIGRDAKGVPRYGMVRSTFSDFKGELEGSDKSFSFRIESKEEAHTLHLFESAIDLLSFITLRMLRHEEWASEDYLSLGGVYEIKGDRPNLPIPLQAYLEHHPFVKTLSFHLDNDEIGRKATKQIMRTLEGQYRLTDEPPKRGKDFNDFLLIEKERRREISR